MSWSKRGIGNLLYGKMTMQFPSDSLHSGKASLPMRETRSKKYAPVFEQQTQKYPPPQREYNPYRDTSFQTLKIRLCLYLYSISFENLIWGIIMGSKTTMDRQGRGRKKRKEERTLVQPWNDWCRKEKNANKRKDLEIQFVKPNVYLSTTRVWEIWLTLQTMFYMVIAFFNTYKIPEKNP